MALSSRHQQFVNEYAGLKFSNATEAYQRVYSGATRETARRNAHVLLTNTDILAEIQHRVDENTLNANEVLVRLGEHARGNMGDFWSIPETGEPSLNLASDRAQRRLHLIKRLKVKTTTRTILVDEDDPVELKTTEIDFELYDAQAALEKIGRHHGIFEQKKPTGAKDDPIHHVTYIKEIRPSDPIANE